MTMENSSEQASIRTNGQRPSVHVSLQGKGGVGKSFVAALLAQYLGRAGSVVCIDSDPVNATLAGYGALKVEHLNILRRGQIQERQFDALVEKICGNDSSFVIDTGATNFVPIWHYLLENEVMRLLEDRGRSTFIHTVVVGGQGLRDTLNGFDEIAGAATGCPVVVWLNEYFGEIEADGNKFEEMPVYQKHRERIAGAVLIPQHNPQTWGEDVREMLESRMTFQEAIDSPQFSLVAKQRLQILRREIFEQLDRLGMF